MSDVLVREFMKLFSVALGDLYDKEKEIIANDVNERCMAAHLFAFMKYKWQEFHALAAYHVDYEYNRAGLNGASKKLFCKYCDDKEKKPHWIIPDLIVHSRGDVSGKNNLVVIEFKKWGIPDDHDKVKLSEMTKQCDDRPYKYKFGCHVIFGRSIDQTEIELYIDGERVGSWQFAELDDLIEMVIKRLRKKRLLLN